MADTNLHDASYAVNATNALAVFHTPELLEMILPELSLPQLLLTQRVSRTSRDTIKASLQLQRALYFKPVDGPILISTTFPPHRIFNCINRFECPVKEKSFDETPPHLDLRSRYKAWSVHESPRVLCNPLLTTSFPWLVQEEDDEPSRPPGPLRDAFLRPEASWKMMLVMQPPLVELIFDCYAASHYHRLPVTGPKDGVTLQDLYDTSVHFHGTVSLSEFIYYHGIRIPNVATAAKKVRGMMEQA